MTFDTSTDVEAWARPITSEIDKGIFNSYVEATRISPHEVLERYAREITLHKEGAAQKTQRIDRGIEP